MKCAPLQTKATTNGSSTHSIRPTTTIHKKFSFIALTLLAQNKFMTISFRPSTVFEIHFNYIDFLLLLFISLLPHRSIDSRRIAFKRSLLLDRCLFRAVRLLSMTMTRCTQSQCKQNSRMINKHTMDKIGLLICSVH